MIPKYLNNLDLDTSFFSTFMIILSRMVTARSTNLRMKGLVIRVLFIPLVRIIKKDVDYVWDLSRNVQCGL